MPLEGSLYTIEQIELLRRLRNTGLTKEQIVTALDTMMRVERELNSLSDSIEIHEITRNPSTGAVTPTISQQETPTQSLVPQQQFTPPQRPSSQSPGSSSPCPISPLSGGEGRVRAASSGITVPTHRGGCDTLMEQLEFPATFRDIPDTDPELKFLASLSLQTTKGLLKDFLHSHNLMQKDLASDIGITQSLASVFLNGPNALRPSTMLIILKWYVWKKRRNEKETANQPSEPPRPNNYKPATQTNENVSLIVQAPSSSTPVSQHSTHKRMLQFLKLKKFRSRINWDPSAVHILEHHFNTKNRFPNAYEREAIAATINGASHGKSRKVTAHHVQTWFNNRRNKRTGVSILSAQKSSTNKEFTHTPTHSNNSSTNQLGSSSHVTSPPLLTHQHHNLIQQASSGFIDQPGIMMTHPPLGSIVMTTAASVGLDSVDQALSALEHANNVNIEDQDDDVIRIKLEA